MSNNSVRTVYNSWRIDKPLSSGRSDLFSDLLMFFFLHHRPILHALLLLLLSCTLTLSLPSTLAASPKGTLKVAILPFHAPSPGDKGNGRAIDTIILSAFSRSDFITLLPNKVVLTTLRELSPALLWGEEKGGEKSGGLIWRINDRLVEEIAASTSANYTIYGSIVRFGERWRVETTLTARGKSGYHRSLTATGLIDSEIPEKVEKIAGKLLAILKRDTLMIEAEEVVRLYMAGMSTYEAAAESLEQLAVEFPDHLPLRLLMLDYYMKDELGYRGEILQVGQKAMALYKGAGEEELRYLRVYGLDPFDVTARAYENRNQWERAIDVRLEALKLLSTNLAAHRAALGLDYYRLARLLDEAGRERAASDRYRNALDYLPPHSKELPIATERFRLLSAAPPD